MMEQAESAALAATILEAAGWKPINSNVMAGQYTAGPLVGGTDPAGESHIKNIDQIKPGHELYSADTPDELHEAAQWLVDRFAAQRAANALASEITFEPPPIDLADPTEWVETPADDEAPVLSDAEARQLYRGNVADDPEPDDDETLDVLDADFSDAENLPDLRQELSEEHPEEYGGGQTRFYMSDDLDRMRTEAAGIVSRLAEQKSSAIEAAVNEQPDEYAALQGFVTTNLDKFTGAFSLQDPDSLAKYRRWLELDRAHWAVIGIDRHRRDLTKMILAASREVVEAFDPEAGWP